jgi:hypothetical protein
MGRTPIKALADALLAKVARQAVLIFRTDRSRGESRAIAVGLTPARTVSWEVLTPQRETLGILLTFHPGVIVARTASI